MPCEHYKDALIEVAASGSTPQGELRAHFDECASCQAAFAEEQSLFAAIDSGLCTAANTEMPVTLLPRVRANLDEAMTTQHRWMRPLALASAGVVLASLLLWIVRPNHPTPENLAKETPAGPAPAFSTAGTHGDIPTSTVQTTPTAAAHSHAPRNPTLTQAVASSSPEVLVSPDEREGLAQLVATLNQHRDFAAAFLAQRPEKKDALVTVDPLQISDLEITPLERTEAEIPDGTGEKH